MTKEELAKVLEEHRRWLANKGGKWADLEGAWLEEANCRGANLENAIGVELETKQAKLD